MNRFYQQFLAVLGLVLVLMTNIVSAQEGRAVLLGTDGSVRIEPKEVKYTFTLFTATDEAAQHPDAIKQLLAEGRDFVPLTSQVTQCRMTGLLTWQVTKAPTQVLAKDDKTLIVRPATEAEKQKGTETREQTNPFGLFALLALLSLALGNLTVKKDWHLATAFVVAAVFFAALAAFVVAALFFAAFTAAFTAAFVAFVAFAALAVFATNKNIRFYRWCSGISAVLMLLAVYLAL